MNLLNTRKRRPTSFSNKKPIVETKPLRRPLWEDNGSETGSIKNNPFHLCRLQSPIQRIHGNTRRNNYGALTERLNSRRLQISVRRQPVSSTCGPEKGPTQDPRKPKSRCIPAQVYLNQLTVPHVIGSRNDFTCNDRMAQRLHAWRSAAKSSS